MMFHLVLISLLDIYRVKSVQPLAGNDESSDNELPFEEFRSLNIDKRYYTDRTISKNCC